MANTNDSQPQNEKSSLTKSSSVKVMTRSNSTKQGNKKSYTNKKLQAKERGQKLAELMQQKRLNGELKKSSKKPRTKSAKAGIYFPVNTVLKNLKKLNPNCRVYENSAVLMAGVLEYLTAEVLELSGNISIGLKKKRINPRHLYLAISNDAELEEMLKDVTIAESGRLPFIHPVLCNPKQKRKSEANVEAKEAHQKKDQPQVDEVAHQVNEEVAEKEPTKNQKRKSSEIVENETEVAENENQVEKETAQPVKKIKTAKKARK